MPTYYGTGSHRIFYKAANFAAGKTISAYLWSPALIKSALLTFTEISDGLYYLDYTFAALGSYPSIFHEDGVKSTFATFLITNAEVDLSAVLAAINALGYGSGPVAHTYTITVGGVACADVLVNMSTDLAGTNYICSGRTNALGQITFYPDVPVGTTVYLWRYKTNVAFTNPDVEVTHV